MLNVEDMSKPKKSCSSNNQTAGLTQLKIQFKHLKHSAKLRFDILATQISNHNDVRFQESISYLSSCFTARWSQHFIGFCYLGFGRLGPKNTKTLEKLKRLTLVKYWITNDKTTFKFVLIKSNFCLNYHHFLQYIWHVNP